MFVNCKRAASTSFRTTKLLPFFKRSLTALVQANYVVIEDFGEHIMKFPSIWLRDNCRCPDCFHESSKSRAVDWETLDVNNIKVQKLSTCEKSRSIDIDWHDGHKSRFDFEWLKAREFKEESQKKYLETFYRPRRIHWGKNKFDEISQRFDFNGVLKSDQELKSWLHALATYGVALVQNAPLEESTNKKLVEHVGFIKRTHYGEEFIVQAKAGAKNFAYQSSFLPLHTDLPYYEYKPSINILHCLVQSKSTGGTNLLADGFFIADRLKQEHLDHFEILKNTLVDWNDIGQENGKAFHSTFRSPIINIDKDGNYTRINRSVPQRDSHFNVPLEEVVPWYKAYAKFVEILREETVSIKMLPGDILTFDNIRLLHGRTAYTDEERNTRYIVGSYIDWDIAYAKLRTLIK